MHCILLKTAKRHARINSESGAGFLRESVGGKPVSKFTVTRKGSSERNPTIVDGKAADAVQQPSGLPDDTASQDSESDGLEVSLKYLMRLLLSLMNSEG